MNQQFMAVIQRGPSLLIAIVPSSWNCLGHQNFSFLFFTQASMPTMNICTCAQLYTVELIWTQEWYLIVYSDRPTKGSPEKERTVAIIISDFSDDFSQGWQKFTTTDNSPSQGFSGRSEDMIISIQNMWIDGLYSLDVGGRRVGLGVGWRMEI